MPATGANTAPASVIVESVASTKPILEVSRGDFILKAMDDAVAALYEDHNARWKAWAVEKLGDGPVLTDATIRDTRIAARNEAKAKYSKMETAEVQKRARADEAARAAKAKP